MSNLKIEIKLLIKKEFQRYLESLDAEASKRGIPRALVRKIWEGMIQSFISYEEELFDEIKELDCSSDC